jgi:Mlc titration factor MtfA (ptsG expression regulator)
MFGSPVLPTISDALWTQATGGYPFIAAQPAAEQEQLRILAQRFIAQHEWAGAGGFELTDAVIVAIAAQACLPVLRLSLDLYDHFVGIVVYPSGFLIPKSEVDEDGVVHEWTEEASGEAWAGGPVILSWEDVSASGLPAGYNVVIHEFAHKLDMADGTDDGIPIFDARYHQELDRSAFAQTLEQTYQSFCEATNTLDDDAETLWNIDLYAAHHPVEFFAVSVETLLTTGMPAHGHALYSWFALLARYLRLPTMP